MNEEIIEKTEHENLSNKNDERYLVPGLIRGLAILEAFNRESNEMTITDIAEALDVNRSSAFRLIYTLEHCGYLRKASAKTYALDSKVMELGFRSISKLSLIDVALPEMKSIRDKIKVAVHLSILEGTDVVFISNVQSSGPFTSTVGLGTRWPAHATVIGQIILASLPVEKVKEKYSNFTNWEVFSERTPKNLNELLKRLDEVRPQKAMISWGHFNHDMAACAAPIYKQSNHEIAAVISVSCPVSTYTEDIFRKKVVPEVISTGERISKFIY